MRRRNFIQSASLSGALISCRAFSAPQGKRPNILMITLEDVSPHLSCYGEKGAKTPVLDKLAAEGTRFTNMFASAPVCGPARCALLTGMYAPSLGGGNMRTHARLPGHIRCYTEYLREAGYFCTNNKKTDYQFIPPKSAWDECGAKAHWKHRAAGQPFFSVINLVSTHQGWVINNYNRAGGTLPPAEKADRNEIHMPRWLGNVPLLREYVGRTYDNLAWTGKRIAEILAELEKTGVADDTIVFFFTDHGDGALPRAKEYIYDSGTKVPFIIKGAKNFPIPGIDKPGMVNDRLCNFVDVPPTVLSMLGLPVPEYMQGTPFLGNPGKEHEFVVATRDRANSRYDTHRAVRDKRFLYIRYLRPYLPLYLKITGFENPGMDALRAEFEKGTLAPEAAQFLTPTKPAEELYDTLNDPDNVINLAADSNYAGTIQTMRGRLMKWMKESGDTGMMPEGMLYLFREKTGSEWAVGQGAENLYDPEKAFRYMTLGHLDGRLDAETALKGIMSPDPIARYWSAINSAYYCKENTARLKKPLTELLDDPYGDIRAAAAFALVKLNLNREAGLQAMKLSADSGHPFERLNALNLMNEFDLNTLRLFKPQLEQLSKINAPQMSPEDYLRRAARDILKFRFT